MSHVAAAVPATTGGPSSTAGHGPLDGPVTWLRVIASEWLRFRTLRSTVLVLAAAIFAMMLFGAVIAHNTRNPAGLDPEDVVASGPLQGYYLGQLLTGSLGVLFVSGEYSTGMIRSTLAAVPKRTPVLLAKVVVFTLVVGTGMVLASIAAFFLAQAVLSGYRATFALTDPDVLRVVVGTGVYLTLVGLLGGAFGWILRSTPGALVALVGTILVLPVLFGLFLGSWGKDVASYFPTGAGQAFSTSLPVPGALSPWIGVGVMVAWVVLGQLVATVLLLRRDA